VTLAVAAAARPVPVLPAADPADTSESRDIAFAVCVMSAAALSLSVRLLLATSSRYPIGDGGLFFAMVRDLEANHLRLPAYTTYNAGHIPFAYPPLALYVVALFNESFGFSLLDVFRFMPILVSVAAVGVFALLARSLLPSRLAAAGAVFVFALLPDAFHWEIKGGGVTRAPGQLFSLLTLWALVRLLRSGRGRDIGLTIVAGSLVLTTHPEWSWFTCYSGGVLFLAFGRTTRAAVACAAAGVGVIVLASPWWGSVLALHGPAPFLASSGGRSHLLAWDAIWQQLVKLDLTHELGLPVATVLALGGVVSSLRFRRFFLPAWLVTSWLADPASWITQDVVPLALLAGVGFAEVLIPLLTPAPHQTGPSASAQPQSFRWAALATGFLVVHGALATTLAEAGNNAALRGSEVTSFQWIRAHTPQSAKFLVVTSLPWEEDSTLEWFPALTDRASVTTLQGREWIRGAFLPNIEIYGAAQRCATETVRCLERWQQRARLQFSYLLVLRQAGPAGSDCCKALRDSLDRDPAYVRVYANPTDVVYRRR